MLYGLRERLGEGPKAMIRNLGFILLGLPILVVVLHTGLRIVRYFYKSPMPQLLANVIDNPLRRRIQPLAEMPIRHGIEPGMIVLEVGPGNGNYTMAAAQRVGEGGRVFTIDIEPRMIERVKQRLVSEGISNVEARVADVFDLPFDGENFDVVYMIAVIGEIPSPELAMKEFSRVLKSSGRLVFSEILFDPDYPRVSTLIRLASSVGFRMKRKIGNLFSYTLILEKHGA